MTTLIQLNNSIENTKGLGEHLFKVEYFSSGVQIVFKFKNGFGASVVKHNGSYGSKQGLFELAVLQFNGSDFTLHYDNEIACGDVVGWLSIDEIDGLLKRIEKF